MDRKYLNRILAGLFFTVAMPCFAVGQRQGKLNIGDYAPRLVIQEWIKGEPVRAFESGKIYVVEFSGSWCPPCRKAIPHLSDLSLKYSQDITIISIYNENNDKNKPYDLGYLQNIRNLVEAMGDKMKFTVAADVPQQTTREIWGISGWPKAFVVDQSARIAWIGHPMDLDTVLNQVVNGLFDASAILERQQEFQESLNRILTLKKEGDYQTALKGIDSLIVANPSKKTWLYNVRFKILAGDDDKNAYKWLRFLLNNPIDGFDWPHFVADTWELVKEPDYDLVLRAYDRTIAESEAPTYAIYPLMMKASIYKKIGEFDKAVTTCLAAIQHCRIDSDDDSYNLRAALHKYQFMVFYRDNINNAYLWLKLMLDTKQLQLDDGEIISALIDTSMGHQPNYQLALHVSTYGEEFAKEHNKKAYFLSQQAKVYESSGDLKNAIKCLEEAIPLTIYKKTKELYKQRIVELTKRK